MSPSVKFTDFAVSRVKKEESVPNLAVLAGGGSSSPYAVTQAHQFASPPTPIKEEDDELVPTQPNTPAPPTPPKDWAPRFPGGAEAHYYQGTEVPRAFRDGTLVAPPESLSTGYARVLDSRRYAGWSAFAEEEKSELPPPPLCAGAGALPSARSVRVVPERDLQRLGAGVAEASAPQSVFGRVTGAAARGPYDGQAGDYRAYRGGGTTGGTGSETDGAQRPLAGGVGTGEAADRSSSDYSKPHHPPPPSSPSSSGESSAESVWYTGPDPWGPAPPRPPTPAYAVPTESVRTSSPSQSPVIPPPLPRRPRRSRLAITAQGRSDLRFAIRRIVHLTFPQCSPPHVDDEDNDWSDNPGLCSTYIGKLVAQYWYEEQRNAYIRVANRMNDHEVTISDAGLNVKLNTVLASAVILDDQGNIRVNDQESPRRCTVVGEVPEGSHVMAFAVREDLHLRQLREQLHVLMAFTSKSGSAEQGDPSETISGLPWPQWIDTRNRTMTRREELMKGQPIMPDSRIRVIHDHIYTQRNASRVVKNKHLNISKNLHRVYKFPSKYQTSRLRGSNVPVNAITVSEATIDAAAVKGIYTNDFQPFQKLFVMIMGYASVPGDHPVTDYDPKTVKDSLLPDIYMGERGRIPSYRHGDEAFKDHFDVDFAAGIAAHPIPPAPAPAPAGADGGGDNAGGDDAPDAAQEESDDPEDTFTTWNPNHIGPEWAWLEVNPQIDFCFRNNAETIPLYS
ncbi:hypothetical protein EV702DRAFT_1273250 [Suillus placidus]|uniref:Uncharacterized protein n=1 Tax=Suillus placidus TaxID=48579 RepID=A0A9P6ZFQ7_9AGAM|nr:hypothetical protein EV702DRAFT_1273250 [Suillus placidus]